MNMVFERKLTIPKEVKEMYPLDAAGKKLVEPGKYLIYAGGSCLDEKVSAEIELR